MFGPLGLPEVILIFIVALLVFGPKQLPEVARKAARTVWEVKRELNKVKNSVEGELNDLDREGDVKEEEEYGPEPLPPEGLSPYPEQPVQEGEKQVGEKQPEEGEKGSEG